MTTICFVLENHIDAVLGGAEYQAHMLAVALSAKPGVSVIYLARNVAGTHSSSRSPYVIKQFGSAQGMRGRTVLFDAPELERVLEEIRPDVIYQRMKQGYTGICARYARKFDIPLFFHVASDGDVHRRPRWRSLANFPFDVLEALIGNWGVRHASHVIAQTSRQQRLLAENFGVEVHAIVPNFHPLPVVLPEKSDGQVRVLWVSNIHTYKMPELFVQLAAAFSGRRDIQFLMVGRPDPSRRMRPTMAAIASQPNLKYFGGLALDEVNRLMSDAHIFVSTSRVEGFPNTFVQAWGRGAVVASLQIDVDGGLEAQGVGFCAGDFARLRSIVDRLSSSPGERSAIAQRAFRHVHERHSLDNADKLCELILRASSQR